ncbi:hypothetical protein G7Y89_g6715 [Cudoniella acicularis]|uniref:Plant heme peroxidase family profile domain-containing protein n=1 Tax=Cudoniella acicularis TaxID=354080 RepID=A0A8H4RJW4_9HELO|nr:hypothetical protein G7Y89_g6715 [Cudoniella acicularis]
MLFPILLIFFLLFQGLKSADLGLVDANGITLGEKVEALERQLLDPNALSVVVSPCSSNFHDDPLRGEQHSAEWVRIVFHDMVTANVAGPGLGGLDASIGFESDRSENKGIFVNNTLGGCIFIYVGSDWNRVPSPSDSLAVATAAFEKAGFSQSEMIQAVACGHSLGGVHRTNFPDIVDGSHQPTFGTDGRASFDSTPAVFDNVGVNEYLKGTGLKGGPLVVGPKSTQSDLRIFASDDNVTVTAMSDAKSFENNCFSTITGHSTSSMPATASYYYETDRGKDIGPQTSQQGAPYPVVNNTDIGFGTISNYAFHDTLTNANIANITIQKSYSAPINQKIFILPSQSFRNQVSNGNTVVNKQYVVRAALLNTLDTSSTAPTVKVWYPSAQTGTVMTKILSKTATMRLKTTLGLYTIFQAVLSVGDGVTALPGITDILQVTLGSAQASAKSTAPQGELGSVLFPSPLLTHHTATTSQANPPHHDEKLEKAEETGYISLADLGDENTQSDYAVRHDEKEGVGKTAAMMLLGSVPRFAPRITLA